jgi:hypothetical protein
VPPSGLLAWRTHRLRGARRSAAAEVFQHGRNGGIDWQRRDDRLRPFFLFVTLLLVCECWGRQQRQQRQQQRQAAHMRELAVRATCSTRTRILATVLLERINLWRLRALL